MTIVIEDERTIHYTLGVNKNTLREDTLPITMKVFASFLAPFILLTSIFLSLSDLTAEESITLTNSTSLNEFTKLGEHGGMFDLVATQEKYLYAIAAYDHFASIAGSEGAKLLAFDLTEPSDPQLVGKSSLFPGQPQKIIIDGPRAYILANSSILVFDISDPTDPRQIGNYVGAADFELNGYLLVIVNNGQRLSIVDFTNPQQPNEIGVWDNPVEQTRLTGGIQIYDKTAYIMNDTGFQIVDISNPTQPKAAGTVLIDNMPLESERNWVSELTVENKRLYVISIIGSSGEFSWSDYFLSIYDISSPAAPQEVISIDMPDKIINLVIRENIGYFLDFDYTLRRSDIKRIDLEALDPSAPYESTSKPRYKGPLSVSEDELYIADGERLNVFDITNSDYTVLIGEYLTVDANHTSIIDQTALFGGNTIDITDLGLPKFITYSKDFAVGHMVTKDNYGFTCCSRGDIPKKIDILDLSDPRFPQLINSYSETQFQPTQIETANGYAYLSQLSQLQIFDITDLQAPDLVKTVELQHEISSLHSSGNNLYIGTGQDMKIFDVTNPISPAQIAAVTNIDEVLSINGFGDFLYLNTKKYEPGSGYQYDLNIIDIGNINSPQVVNTQAISEFVDASIENGYYYYGTKNSLKIYSLANPVEPTEVGQYALGESYPFRTVAGLEVEGNYVFVNHLGDLIILDVTDPANVIEIGSIRDDQESLKVPMTISNGLLVVQIGFSRLDFQILDVSNPADVTVLWDSSNVNIGFRSEFLIDGDRLFTVGTDGFRIIDISNPTEPIQLGVYTSLYWIRSLAQSGDYLYVTANQPDLTILDISLAPEISKVSEFNISSFADRRNTYDIVIREPYAYVTNLQGLLVLNISNPLNVEQIGFYDSDKSLGPAAITGNHIFAATNEKFNNEVQIIDISNPANPLLVEKYDEDIFDMVIQGGYGYFVQNESPVGSNLILLNILDPLQPLEVARLGQIQFSENGVSPLTNILDVEIANGLIFVVEETFGMTIFHYPSMSQTFVPGGEQTLPYTNQQGSQFNITTSPSSFETTTTLFFDELAASEIPAGKTFVGSPFDLRAYENGAAQTNLTFNQSLSLTVQYSAFDSLVISDELELNLYQWDNDQWLLIKGCGGSVVRDPAAKLVTFPLCEIGRYAVLGPTNQMFMPIAADS